MHRRNYTINGTNPKTGRSNKRRLRAFSEEECKLLAMTTEGLVEPIAIVAIYDDSPSENQVSYARHLGINIPSSITQQELSELISFKVENDELATESLKRYATELGVEFSGHIGSRNLAGRIIDILVSNNKEKIAFYLWVVYNLVNGAEITSLKEAANQPVFEDFGSEMAGDGKFLQSFSNELGYGQNNSFSILFSHNYLDHFAQSRAYCVEKAKHYLRYKFKIERWRTLASNSKQPGFETRRSHEEYAVPEVSSSFSYKDTQYNTGRGAMPQPKPKATGCAPVILLLFVFMLVVSLTL